MTSTTPSFQLLINYLETHGYQVKSLDIDDIFNGYVTISSLTTDGRLLLNSKSPTYPFATTSARRVFKNKAMAYAYIGSFNVATPSTMVVESYSSDLDSFLDTHGLVIVKPNSGQGGKGLTLKIKSHEQLKAAVENALTFSDKVLVQRQFIGEEVRFTTFNGKVKSALLRQKPNVVGNGTSTVAQLIEDENEARRQLTFSAVQYPMLDENLISSDLLHSQAVPADGERVELGLGTMIRNGASMYEIIDSIDQSYIEIVEKISETFGHGIIAIDMMIGDVSTVATQDNYIFLEMNNDPALVLYYSCRNGNQFDVVSEYLGPMLITAIEGNAQV